MQLRESSAGEITEGKKTKIEMVQLTLKELLATFYQAAIIFHFAGLFLTDSQALATKPTITSKKMTPENNICIAKYLN